MKILYISSLDPTSGPGAIAMDHYNALNSVCYDTDFLTLYPVDNFPKIKYALKRKYRKFGIHQFRYKLLKFIIKSKYYRDSGFFYRKETEPPVPFRRIKKLLSKDYDIIIVFFWQGLLSFKTLNDIYNHIGTNPKVVFISADYSPMTGGCHFIGNCNNYTSGCGCCPMINSSKENDFTNWNNKYRQKIIGEIKPYVGVNSYMRKFFQESTVMKAGAHLFNLSMTMDLGKFQPTKSDYLLNKYNLDIENKFIILFGCQNLNDPRKGMTHLVEALNLFHSKLSEEDAANVLIISIGKDSNELSQKIKFERKHLGYVPFDELPFVYSMATVFVSPSINDAGPSMVNQAIACGTPVVAFEIGCALDIIKEKGTGYTVPLIDVAAFADAIFKIYGMENEEYQRFSDRCRDIAFQYQSYEAFTKTISNILTNNA